MKDDRATLILIAAIIFVIMVVILAALGIVLTWEGDLPEGG